MISTSQKEHLTYTLVWQVITLIAVWIITWQYIIPGFAKIDENLTKAEKAVTSFGEATEKWYEYGRLSAILTEMWNKDELLKIIQATPNETKIAIQKEWNWDYLSWVKNAINASEEDKKKLVQAKKKINSILPTMSPISANIDEENITLKQYIKFIEWRLIKNFNLDSNISLWIQWLSYGNPSNWVPSSIGMFDLRFDFKAPNEDIKRFIDFINDSWNSDILSQSWLLTEDQIPEIMSNPLITMEWFSLQDTLDVKNNPTKLNSGRASIRFYVRWASKDDVNYLKENLKSRKEEFQKRVDNAVSECRKNEVLCSQLDKLTAFQIKFNEFLRWVGWDGWTNIWWTWINDIYLLSQQVISLRTLEAEFDTFNAKITQ